MCQFTISFVGAVHSLCVPCVLSRSHRARMRSAQRVAHCVMASSSQSIDVPADGLCFYHCVGYALRGGRASFEVSYAETLRAQVCRILTDMGFEQEAVRLKLEGSEGYPDELAFAAAARLLQGRLEVLSQEGILRSYGDGTLRLRVVQVLVYDGAGHGSPHFRVLAMDYAATVAGDPSMDAVESALHAAYDRLGPRTRLYPYGHVHTCGLGRWDEGEGCTVGP